MSRVRVQTTTEFVIPASFRRVKAAAREVFGALDAELKSSPELAGSLTWNPQLPGFDLAIKAKNAGNNRSQISLVRVHPRFTVVRVVAHDSIPASLFEQLGGSRPILREAAQRDNLAFRQPLMDALGR